jgi:glycosyltransferase involved in cell wall biosynthesis
VKLSINTDEILHVSIERQKFYDYLQKPGLIIGSYPEVKQFKEIPTIKDHLPRNVTIIHSGTLRPTYASDQFIEAMRIVTRIRPQARFIVLGGYVKLLKNIDILRNLQKENKLEIKQQLPFGEVLQYYKISDIGISLVLPIDNTHKLAAPQKLYEYFASGIPVIAANVPTMRNIITKNECGIIVDAESPVSIAKGIIRLIDDKYLRQKYGKNARKLIKSIYNWESQTEKLYLLIRAYIVGNNH